MRVGRDPQRREGHLAGPPLVEAHGSRPRWCWYQASDALDIGDDEDEVIEGGGAPHGPIVTNRQGRTPRDWRRRTTGMEAHALRHQDGPRAHDLAGRCWTSGGPPTTSTVFESALELGPLLPADRRPPRARTSRAGRCWPHMAQATRRIRLGVPGDGHGLPPPGGAGQHGGDRRRDLGRTARARPRRGLEPDGVRRLRDRAPAAAGAVRPLRRGVEAIVGAAHRRGRRPSRAGTCSCTEAWCEPKPIAATAPADRHRRARAHADAADRGALGAAVERHRAGPSRLAAAEGGPGRPLRRPSDATRRRSPARSTCRLAEVGGIGAGGRDRGAGTRDSASTW